MGIRQGCSDGRKRSGKKGDARILGSGNFVTEALRKAGEDWERSTRKKMPIEQLILKVSKHLDLKESSIVSASRRRVVSEARGIICCLAINDFGYSAKEVANALGLRRVSAGQCVVRGEKMLDKEPDLRDKLTIN